MGFIVTFECEACGHRFGTLFEPIELVCQICGKSECEFCGTDVTCSICGRTMCSECDENGICLECIEEKQNENSEDGEE